ncbi:hypothetical protein KEM55_008569, partial [Ascosphaera atra]
MTATTVTRSHGAGLIPVRTISSDSSTTAIQANASGMGRRAGSRPGQNVEEQLETAIELAGSGPSGSSAGDVRMSAMEADVVEPNGTRARRIVRDYSWATPYEFPERKKPSILKRAKWLLMEVTSFFLTFGFLIAIAIPAFLCELGNSCKRMIYRITHCSNPHAKRPFYAEEKERMARRRVAEQEWIKAQKRRSWRKNEASSVPIDPERGIVSPATAAEGRNANASAAGAVVTDLDTQRGNENDGNESVTSVGYTPLAGGKDDLNRDIGYYAKRVGLNAERYRVLTRDGYILELWHVYNPKEYVPRKEEERGTTLVPPTRSSNKRKYPILMISGLLQHIGTYCANDDASLAFYLSKIGYDIWLGGNRCGFIPEHMRLSPRETRFWKWNVKHMGIFDLPAHLSRVRFETGFEKVALVAHSQGTTQTLYALSHQRMAAGIGSQISVACLLSPAAYAGPTLEKLPFRFVRSLPRPVYKFVFGQHSFIPAMVHAEKYVPKAIVAYMAYAMFTYLFSWSDERWERNLRARMFGFAPVFVSAEHMWWWLSKKGFAGRGCMFWEGDEDPVTGLEGMGVNVELDAPQGGIAEPTQNGAQTRQKTTHLPSTALPSSAAHPPGVSSN